MFERKKGVIISGFAGIGKSSLKEKVPSLSDLCLFDLDSHAFLKERGWEKLYVECAIALTQKYDYVFVSTHDSVISELLLKKGNFYVVYPVMSCKEEYRERFLSRGNDANFVNKFMACWDSYIEKLDNLRISNKISLHKGQYLSDVITRIRVIR